MARQKINYFEYGQLLFKNYSTVLRNKDLEERVLAIFQNQPNKILFDNHTHPRVFINDYLLRYYPNETTVKSLFINNVLSKFKSHVVIFELNVGKSRLDLCHISRESVAYEIKTELDTTARLEMQMRDYFKVFEKVYLICSENSIDKMIPNIPDECGIYTYRITKTGRYIFKRKRTAIKSEQISPKEQLLSLTKKELQLYFQVENNNKEKMVKSIAKLYSSKYINKMFKLILRNKYREKWEFFLEYKPDILEIDYQWFYKNTMIPKIVYH